MSAISLQTFFFGNAASAANAAGAANPANAGNAGNADSGTSAGNTANAEMPAELLLPGKPQTSGTLSLTEEERRSVEFGALFAIHVEPQIQTPILPAGTETTGIQPDTPEHIELLSSPETFAQLSAPPAPIQSSLNPSSDDSNYTDIEFLQDVGLIPADVRTSHRPAVEFDSSAPDSIQSSTLDAKLATDLRALKDPIEHQNAPSTTDQIRFVPRVEGQETEELEPDTPTAGQHESQFRHLPAEAGPTELRKSPRVTASDMRVAEGPAVEQEREHRSRPEEINLQDLITEVDEAALLESVNETPDEPVRVHVSDLQEFITQEVHSSALRTAGTNRESITIRLDPPELGEVTIEFSSDAEGLSLHIQAADSGTLELVQAVTEEINAGELSQRDSVFSQAEFSLSAGADSGNSEPEQERSQASSAEPVELSAQPVEDDSQLNIVA